MQLDQITEKRLATIKEIAESKPKIESEKPFSTSLYYAILSLILFAVTHNLPYANKVWFVLSGIGIIIGVILWARKISNALVSRGKEKQRDRIYH